jgi:hypothetical protein
MAIFRLLVWIFTSRSHAPRGNEALWLKAVPFDSATRFF